MHTYSTIVVIDSLLKADEIDATIDKIERNIINNGGEILKVDRWGKKRLAYEIKKRQYGYYVEILFKAMGNIIKIIEREYGLDENILRYLTLKLDKKALEFYKSKLEEAASATRAETAPAEKPARVEASNESTTEATSEPQDEAGTEDVPVETEADQQSSDDVSNTQETQDDEEDVENS